MSLTLHSVVNAKTPAGEKVWLLATEDVNLSGYAVVDRTFDPKGTVSNEFRHIFVFPGKAIKKNQFVCLHTGNGTYNVTEVSGQTHHHFYWQSGSCVWNDKGGDTATLIKFTTVNSKIVPKVE